MIKGLCCQHLCIGVLLLLLVICIVWYSVSRSCRRYVNDYAGPFIKLVFVCFFMSEFGVKVLGVEIQDLLGLWSTATTVLLGLLVYRSQRQLLTNQIVDRISGELLEIYRHLGENLNVLDCIDSSKGIPSMLHIKKLAITRYSSLSDEDTLKNLKSKYSRIIFPMTVRVRNYNINIDALVEYLNSSASEQKKFDEYRDCIRKNTVVFRRHIRRVVKELDAPRKFKATKSKERKIIYDRAW